MKRSVLDIDDLLQDEHLRNLVNPERVEMCGERFIATGNPFPPCIVCGGSKVIASVGDCPECVK